MIIDRLRPIFLDILDEPELAFSGNLSPLDCAHWDSVAQVRLVLAVEDEFGIQFATEDVAAFKTVGDFIAALNKLGFRDADA
jgi:acyl carrier protein